MVDKKGGANDKEPHDDAHGIAVPTPSPAQRAGAMKDARIRV
jgi:hypothetical protein